MLLLRNTDASNPPRPVNSRCGSGPIRFRRFKRVLGRLKTLPRLPDRLGRGDALLVLERVEYTGVVPGERRHAVPGLLCDIGGANSDSRTAVTFQMTPG